VIGPCKLDLGPELTCAEMAARRQILALDPGTTESGVVLYQGGRVVESGVHSNEDVRRIIQVTPASLLAVEMIASYGMPVGKEVFETCVWIGRFLEAWQNTWGDETRAPTRLVYRKDVKLHLCGTTKAKDPNVRQALLDKLGPQGTKKAPGPTYGVSKHAWAALAVAVTVSDSLQQAAA
jgi:hypothetical protein